VVAAATQFTLPYLQRHRVTLSADVPDGLPLLVADPAQLEQVFVQLFLSACKAMPQGGTLTVRARAAERRLVAEVADTGPGIAQERLKHIFTPFYSGFGEGSGLGLSLCQRIIAAHQGTLQVESTEGKGTLFRIELPLEAADAPRAAR
jgi:signal transduction histidine kinase